MRVRRYGQRSRSVLSGTNAAPYTGPTRHKQPREVDWARLESNARTPSHKTGPPDQGYVVTISLTMNSPTPTQ